MASGGESDRNSFSAPPGLTLDTTSSSATEDSLLVDGSDALMEALKQELAVTAAEKVQEIWQRGKRAMIQSQQKQAEQIEKLSGEVSLCIERQKCLEAENEQLKQTLAKVTERFSLVGALFGALPAVTAIPQKTHDNWGKSKTGGSPPRPGESTSDDTRTSSTATPGTLGTSSDAISPPSGLRGSKDLDRLPDLPAFPFSSSQAVVTSQGSSSAGIPSVQNVVPTQLVLDEVVPPSAVAPVPASSNASVAVAAEKLQTAPTPLCLDSSLPPAASGASVDAVAKAVGDKSGIFSFQLRKADNTELGLTVSHVDSDRYLRVENVRADGAVESWNRQCMDSAFPEKVVVRGDLIISVNGITHDTERMLDECKNKQLLKIVICRGVEDLRVAFPKSPVTSTCKDVEGENAQIQAALKSSSLRAEATEFVPLCSDSSEALVTSEELS